jgi:hypothetical protein
MIGAAKCNEAGKTVTIIKLYISIL